MTSHRAWRSWCALTALFVGAWCPVSVAIAEGEVPLVLEWPVIAGCPSRDEVLDEIARMLGPRGAHRSRVTAIATILVSDASTAPGDASRSFRVTLRISSHGGGGQRTLEGPSCRTLASATAVILALIIDPDAAAAPLPPSASASSTPPEPPVSSFAPIPWPPPPAPPPPASTTRIEPFAVAVLDGATLPNATLGAGAGVAVGRGIGLVRATVTYHPGTRGDAEQPPAGATFDLLHASVEACARLPLGGAIVWRGLFGCAGGSVERVHGSGLGVAFPARNSAIWPSTLAQVLTGISAGRGFADLGVGGVVPLVRRTFVIDGAGRVYEPPPAARVTLAVGATF